MRLHSEKKKRRGCAFLAVLLSVCALAGCGKTTGDTTGEDSSQAGNEGAASFAPTGSGAKGRFVESDVSFPEEVTQIRCIGTRADGGVTVLADGTDAEKTWLFTADNAGGDWTAQEVELSLADSWVSGAAAAPDGSVWLSGSFADTDAARVKKINPDGSVEEKIPGMPEVKERDANNVITQMGIDTAGRIFVLDLNGDVLKMNPETGECAERIECGGEYVHYFGIAGEKLIMISESGIHVSDTATGTALPEDVVLSELIAADSSLKSSDTEGVFPLVFTAGMEPGSIIHADRSGIYCHQDNATVNEQLVSGDLNSIGSLNLVQIAMAGEEDFLIFGKDATGSKVLRFCYDKDVSALPETELTIYALEDSALLRQAVGIYQKENSGVFVTIKIGMTEKDGVTAEDAVAALNTEIMAGNAPDVIILDGLPADSYMEKGLLADISGIVAEVEQTDGLFTNVKNAYEKDGAIYGMPVRFFPVVVFGMEDAVRAGETVTGYADYIERAAAENPEKQVVYDLPARGVLWTLYRADSAKWIKGDGTLYEERLTEYLTAAKKIYDTGMDKSERRFYTRFDNVLYGTSGAGASYVMDGEVLSCYGTMVDLVGLEILLAAAEKTGGDYGILGGEQTKSFVPHLQVGISNASDVQEAAEAFLKILLGKECGSIDQNGFPVNRAGWAAVCEEKIKMYGSESTISISSTDENGQERGYMMNDLSQEETDKLAVLLESLTVPSLTDAVIEEVIIAQGEAYLKDEISLQDAVAAIRQKISIYLAE